MLLKTQIQNIIWSLQIQPFIILKSSLFLAWKSTLCDIYMAISAFFRLLFKFLVSTCTSIKYVSWKWNLALFCLWPSWHNSCLFYWSICPLHLIQIITISIWIYYLTICYLFTLIIMILFLSFLTFFRINFYYSIFLLY